MIKFKARASSAGLLKFNKGITDVQLAELDKLQTRKEEKDNLTPTMEAKLEDLIIKRDTVPELNATTKTYLRNWVKEQLYSRRKPLDTAPLRKGLVKEDDSIAFIAETLNYKGIKKNIDWKEDEYFTGECDVDYAVADTIIDVKNSYSCFSFPLFEEENENGIYYGQAQVYMHLWGRAKYELIYTLMDMPEEEIDKLFRFNNKDNLEYEEFKKDFLYEHLPAALRVKVFQIEKKPEYITELQRIVLACRDYITFELGYAQN